MKNSIGMCFVVACFCSLALAQDRHEVTLSATSAKITIKGSTFSLGTSVRYDYLVMHSSQLGGMAGFGFTSGGGASSTALAFLAGPTVNIPLNGSFRNSIFLSGGVGFVNGSVEGLGFGASTGTEFAFGFSAGKRFHLTGGLTIKPYIGLNKVAGQDIQVNIVPVSFGLIF